MTKKRLALLAVLISILVVIGAQPAAVARIVDSFVAGTADARGAESNLLLLLGTGLLGLAGVIRRQMRKSSVPEPRSSPSDVRPAGAL